MTLTPLSLWAGSWAYFFSFYAWLCDLQVENGRVGVLLSQLQRGHPDSIRVLRGIWWAELAGSGGWHWVHGLRPAAAPQPALQRPAVCHLEHGALVPGQCSEQVTPSWHLLEEDLPKLGEKEPGSYSGTTKRMCPGIGGVQRCRTCPCSPPMLSYEHIPVPQTCTCLCTSAFLIAHSLFSGLPILSPLLCFYQTSSHLALAWFLSQAWWRRSVGRRAPVHQLGCTVAHTCCETGGHGFCLCWLFPCILLPCITTPRQQYTGNSGDLLFAVCLHRASPNTPMWCIFDACVHLHLQEWKQLKLCVLSAAR